PVSQQCHVGSALPRSFPAAHGGLCFSAGICGSYGANRPQQGSQISPLKKRRDRVLCRNCRKKQY
ncbi:uncharacterized, partial [Tachysurus ichikawai]